MKKLLKGKVVLAGAGPGDPDLISVKALKYLKKADIILTDRLVSPILIEENASPTAQIIYVGKQCSRGIHTPQTDINELMVAYAQEGYLVLRLKGGDASLFSNILDELIYLRDHQISYEIIPGISAAFGAAAYTGIPLTARGYSRGLRISTLYDIKSIQVEQWKDWAQTDDTLVFYMSGQKLEELVLNLKIFQTSNEKEIAIIEQATTPSQRTQILRLDEIDEFNFPQFDFVPTLIIIGKVVQLHKEFSWLNESITSTSYFDNHKNIFTHAG